MKRIGLFLVLILTVGWAGLWAQPPALENARLQTHSAQNGLEPLFRTLSSGGGEPAWIGYGVPAVSGHVSGCCGRCSSPKPCRLESDDWRTYGHCDQDRVATDARLLVLFRVGAAGVEKMRISSQDCALDAGGLAFHWLADVKPQESLALLSTFCSGRDPDRGKHSIADASVMAIALHADPGADAVMQRLTDSNQPEGLRSRVAFWLGAARGRPGYEQLRRMLKDDSSDKVREQVVFGLSLTKVPEALDLLIQTARADSSAHVRGQALFWLAQKAGDRVAGVISEAIRDDPETEVKTKAVFALTQIPDGEGIPKLIEVARTNRNPEVRKQAVFWLGQSRDPRALSFIEKVLTE